MSERRPCGIRNAQLVKEIEGRQKSEAALRESEEKYRDLVENINDLIYAIDKDGVVTYVSPTVEQILGYRPDEIIGRAFMKLIHPEDIQRIIQRFGWVMEGKIEPQDYRVLKKDGSHGWVRVSSRPVYRDGAPIGLQGVLTDITETKRLEMKLKQAHKMEAIGTLAGGVAHDLNNILSGLVSYPQLLLLELPSDSPLRSSIKTIQKSGEKAAAIVQDLLTLARRGVSATEMVNLNTIVQEYMESPEYAQLMTHYPGVILPCGSGAGICLNVRGSRVHLAKTLMNLVVNAAEAVDSQGEVFIATKNKHVDTRSSSMPQLVEGDYVSLSIKDNGIGIQPEDINKIFEPFYTKKAMGRSGTGLGMAVVWGAVQDHQGYIDVESSPGKGSTFYLYFPATRQAPEEEMLYDSEVAINGRGESVLVIDDVVEQRKIAGSNVVETRL